MKMFRFGGAALESGACQWPTFQSGVWVQTPLRGPVCLTEGSVAGAHIIDRNYFTAQDFNTGELTVLFDPASRTSDPLAGLSDVCGRGGIAAGFLVGYWDNSGWAWRQGRPSCPLAIDDSGAVCVQRQRGYGGLDIYVEDEVIPLDNRIGGYGATAEYGVFIINFGQQVYRWTLAERRFEFLFTLPPWIRDRITYSGGWFQGWHNEVGGVVVWQGVDLSRGYIVATGETLHNPMLTRLGPVLHVTSCTGPGEYTSELQRRTATLPSLTGWRPVDLLAPPVSTPEPIRIPTFTPTDQKIAIGLLDEPGGPDFYGAKTASSHEAVFYTIDSHDDLATAIATAKAQHLVLAVYDDRQPYRHTKFKEVAPVAEAEGVTARALVRCYPEPAETAFDFKAKLDANCEDLADRGIPFDFIGAAYRRVVNVGQYLLTEQKVLDRMPVVFDVGVRYRVGAIWWFLYRRPEEGKGPMLDGALMWPSFMEAINRQRAASADWRHFPKPLEAAFTKDTDMLRLNAKKLEHPTSGYFQDRYVCKGNTGLNLSFDQNGNVVGFVPEVGAQQCVIWDGQSAEAHMEIECYRVPFGVYNL